jgi:hypothetical protein
MGVTGLVVMASLQETAPLGDHHVDEVMAVVHHDVLLESVGLLARGELRARAFPRRVEARSGRLGAGRVVEAVTVVTAS